MPQATAIVNARVFDGAGTDPVLADVLVDCSRIVEIATHLGRSARSWARIVDGTGAVLLPGLIDGHAHLGFGSTTRYRSDRSESNEEKALLIAHAGAVLLDSGFTRSELAWSGRATSPACSLSTEIPLEDIGLLADQRNLTMIMKDGRAHKLDASRTARPDPAGS